MERASVSLKTPKLPTSGQSRNGSGDAIQTWNSDHASATPSRMRRDSPLGERPPVSASATSCCTSGAFAAEPFSVLIAVPCLPRGRAHAP
jgi:hypothetical protein